MGSSVANATSLTKPSTLDLAKPLQHCMTQAYGKAIRWHS